MLFRSNDTATTEIYTQRALFPYTTLFRSPCATHLFNQPAYDFWAFRKNSLRVHAPGAIKLAKESAGRVSFDVESWVKAPYYVLVNGLAKKPGVALNGQPMDLSGGNQFLEKEGWLILELKGKARVEIML